LAKCVVILDDSVADYLRLLFIEVGNFLALKISSDAFIAFNLAFKA
jgi:hypothetical protein